MLGLSGSEVAIIAILAVILLGPDRLKESARGLGKALREVRRATDGVRTSWEAHTSDLLEDRAPDAGARPPAAAADGSAGTTTTTGTPTAPGEPEVATAAPASPLPTLAQLQPVSLAALAGAAGPASRPAPEAKRTGGP